MKNSNIKGKNKKKRKIFLIIVIILIILLLSGTWFGYRVYKNGGGLQGILATIVGHDENTLKNLPKVYCLVTGQSQNLTDTLMLCSYDHLYYLYQEIHLLVKIKIELQHLIK